MWAVGTAGRTRDFADGWLTGAGPGGSRGANVLIRNGIQRPPRVSPNALGGQGDMVRRSQMPRRLSSKRALLLAFVISAASCGPSSHELAQAREAERLRNVAESEKVLKAFAEKHGAEPFDILDPKVTERVSTAHLQDELEGLRSPSVDHSLISCGGHPTQASTN